MDIKKLKDWANELCKAFLQLKTEEEMFNFVRDLMTESEILEFSQRLEIAKRLFNWQSYKKIEEDTKASSTTIARVAKFLHWKFWGYKNIFEKNKSN